MSTNLILIDSNLKDTNVLLSALNDETFGIIYDYDTSRNIILQQIENEFGGKSVSRIAICCHEGVNQFLENGNFFDLDGSTNEVIKDANTLFILDLLKRYNVSNIDYLACDSLQYDSWRKFYDLIENEVEGVTVGASEDQTGNLKYSGNWVMENTGEQVDGIYFNKGLEYYKYLLVWTSGNLTYTNDTVTSRSTNTTSYIVKKFNTNDNCFVTKIGDILMEGFTNLNYSFSMPNSITTIGVNAFRNSVLVGTLKLPHSVTTISSGAFFSCRADILYLPFELNWINLGSDVFKMFAYHTNPTNAYVYRWFGFDLKQKTFSNIQESSLTVIQDGILDLSNWTNYDSLICNIVGTQNTNNTYNITLTFNYNVFSYDTDILSGLEARDIDDNIIGTFSNATQGSSYDYAYNQGVWNVKYNPGTSYFNVDIVFKKTKNAVIFSSSSYNIQISPPTLDLFTIDPSNITVENSPATINMTFSNDAITQTDISNSLTVDPSNSGTITNITGLGTDWSANFIPNYGLDLTDCSLNFIYGSDINQTKKFNIETLQQIKSVILTPDTIISDLSSNLEVILRIPSTVAPNISIDPSYVAYLDGSITSSDNLIWTGTIQRYQGFNSINNILTVDISGVSNNITFDALEEDVVLSSNYHITNSGKKIMYLPFSQSAEDNQCKIEVYDSSGNLEHTFSDDVVGSVYVNHEGNLIVIGLPTIIKSYLFEDGSWNEAYNGNNEYISDANLGELVHLTGNNELMVVNNTTASNYEVDIYKESVAHYVTYFATDVSSIVYPDNSLNFEIRLTTNDVPLADISANASTLFSIDPSYVGYIDANSLSLSNYGYSLNGTFTVSGEYNLSGVKLFYNDFSSNSISLDSVLDLSINSFQFDISSNVTYLLDYTTNKITLNLNRGDINNVDVSNSLTLDPLNCGSITDVIDGSNSYIKKITFEPAFQFENANCSLTFDYSKDLLDASQTILFSVNNYVPQITNITNDNSFNYIDTSGTILLEFDRNLLRDMELSDLSYNATKLDLQLEKLSESSYNILVDPSGEYAETQVITVKDLLGTDLSNISLEIDTVIPSMNEIVLSPNMLTYGATEGILDVKFNKKLLDIDQLVLTSSSNIGFSFKQQLNETPASIVVTEVNNPPDHPLVNFTYTIEGTDVSENIVKSALQKWDNIITRHPIDVSNDAVGGTTKIHITFSVSEMDAGTLGYAYVDYVYQDDLNHNGIIDFSDNIYTSSGFIALSQASYDSMISETRTDGTITNTTLYYVLMHEIGHIIGIGPYFGHNNSPRVAYEESGVTKYYYTGVNALAKYKMYMGDASLVGIPIEDDGGAGTANVHPEEHRIQGQTRHIGGHPHEGLDEELMTGWTESGNTIMPLSAVSIGFLQDMGYEVNYSYADEYRGINVDSNGDKILGSLLNSGANVYSTYSVVQYDVSVNYGIKNMEDISFNYRGNYDVSNIDIEVNTIIPDVASIDIENILYSDTSGIVTITFNDHDGYYFHDKDASMNIYLDPSLNGNITINMEPISDSSNVWQGVITSISGEFYPDAKLYLQHSGLDGLINVDVSANYRVDTDIRGLFITLPEMYPSRNTGITQSINYLTYDHNTNKLETDVSFQFNIDVSGVNHDSRQFPYIDICENFIEITSTDLSSGIIELDKGIGFIGNFWNGILTVSGEVEGTFDICYNETLNPLRDDGVIEIREDKLTVNVNTKLPDISNVIVPYKLTYLDISGDVEIEFNKAILPGDEDNIQIEYSLGNTNEYQFLDKYEDNAVSYDNIDSNNKYVFNGISYNTNKQIALGIGTYTLTGITNTHAMTLKNILSDDFVSISGELNVSKNGIQYFYGTNVIITVTGDFGTASYDCYNHGYNMGGQNRLVYKDVEVSSLSGSATHWKYTLSLLQEIDTSLNVTIKYRDEVSGPPSILVRGTVPDVSSVALSPTDLTYNDTSCVVTVEFNNALQHRTNIYDLISLEPSSNLFIQGASFSSTNDRVWTGILDISNNVKNEFDYTDAKVSVNGIQSAAFGQGISGELLFDIDTILPDISNVSVTKMRHSDKRSNFVITFTKDDLHDHVIDISNSLSVTNNNLSITNVGFTSDNILTGNIQTDVSGIFEDVGFVIDYSFNYRNDTLTKHLYRTIDFEVDTRERDVKILDIINNITTTYQGNNYLFTYLSNIANLTLDFYTNELSGFDVSSDMSFNQYVNYSLSNSMVNDTSLNATITVDMSQNLGPLTFTYNDGTREETTDPFYIDTRTRNMTRITLSRTNLTYDASSTQLDVYFDAPLLDTNASQVLDDSLAKSFTYSSINISAFTEISKTHYRANITTEYNIDKSEGNSVTVNYMDNSATVTFNVDTILRPYSNICFPRGEKVLTDNGYKNIEQIDIKLDTIRGEKIEELTQTQTQEKNLVLIKCGALMKNMPCKDTLITNNHKVLYKGKLVEAYKLVTLVESGVILVDYNGETLYNILLEGEKEGKMVVNGMIVETLSHTNNIARLYRKIRKYGTREYKKKRMIELYNKFKR